MEALEVVDGGDIFNNRLGHLGLYPLVEVKHELGLLFTIEC